MDTDAFGNHREFAITDLVEGRCQNRTRFPVSILKYSGPSIKVSKESFAIF
jgi:hypothetical protein